mgnify:CR=1 FL=1
MPYTDSGDSRVTNFTHDSTLYLPVKEGDFLIFCFFRGLLYKKEEAYTIADIWELRDGDKVTISNRPCDFPDWFQLHPTEVCNRFAHEMMKKLKAGYEPKEVMDGPNIWRLRDGDRLIWMGESRTGYPDDLGLLQVFDFKSCALIAGEPHDSGFESFVEFGSVTDRWEKTKASIKGQNAFFLVTYLGLPRTFSPEWKIG